MDQIQGLKYRNTHGWEIGRGDDHFKFGTCKDTEMEKRTSTF